VHEVPGRKEPQATQYPRSSSLSKQSNFTTISGENIGTINKKPIWKLTSEQQEEWEHIKNRIEMLIRRTPASSKGKSTPIVVIQGYLIGTTKLESHPNVVIYSNSPPYSSQLQKAIRKSTILDGSKFKVMVAEAPIAKGQADNEQEAHFWNVGADVKKVIQWLPGFSRSVRKTRTAEQEEV